MRNFSKKELMIPIDHQSLPATLSIPEQAKGLIIFVHGSGSSRSSSRNIKVATILNENGFGTLLFDLLSKKEEEVRDNRFNIYLLSERLIEVTGWIMGYEDTRGLNIGYFGASTGAAAALTVAAKLGYKIKAIVSRGGRTDLALNSMDQLPAAVLLIAGSLDTEIIQINQNTFSKLIAEKEIRIIQGASHLFEEPGKLEELAVISSSWFDEYLTNKAD